MIPNNTKSNPFTTPTPFPKIPLLPVSWFVLDELVGAPVPPGPSGFDPVPGPFGFDPVPGPFVPGPFGFGPVPGPFGFGPVPGPFGFDPGDPVPPGVAGDEVPGAPVPGLPPGLPVPPPDDPVDTAPVCPCDVTVNPVEVGPNTAQLGTWDPGAHDSWQDRVPSLAVHHWQMGRRF